MPSYTSHSLRPMNILETILITLLVRYKRSILKKKTEVVVWMNISRSIKGKTRKEKEENLRKIDFWVRIQHQKMVMNVKCFFGVIEWKALSELSSSTWRRKSFLLDNKKKSIQFGYRKTFKIRSQTSSTCTSRSSLNNYCSMKLCGQRKNGKISWSKVYIFIGIQMKKKIILIVSTTLKEM